ncbi:MULTISPECIES: ABC transporter ATP-binding protein [Corynebacterium]|uniref:ABC transporter ATP-binding protein n=1 Tax=Corynebacterium TaxID=1716 RepID=UPI0009F2056D|nr:MULTISPECIES: ABC transporter ATP-binding protein [Corynebacterium]PLA27240.1 ABC transporter ATP-binding protein [Corynebacterium coyleae]UBI09077.1 ABC transporter ATP-binding protein [Corynebacterium coyleae]UBI09085.1 ABC transporter ATP-binding protein [Corynebacterium coyleae]
MKIVTRDTPVSWQHSTLNTAIQVESLTVGHNRRVISEDLSLIVPEGGYTAIIGPNACGKSTLLRAISRILPYEQGRVLIHGADIAHVPTRRLATRLGLLPQSSFSPEGIRVEDLVARGRHPHLGIFGRWSKADDDAVVEAMAATGISDLSGRQVDELSGGQRQRVWVAMVLAQATPILLLDEPTTFLDIAHQYGLLDLFERLRRNMGRTIVAVLHDLNQAARYATHLIVMKDGKVVTSGPPADVITAELIEHVYELPCRIAPDPETGSPMVIPLPQFS